MVHVCARPDEDAGEIDIDVLAKILERDVADRLDRIEHTSVVDPQVDRTKALFSPDDECIERFFVPHIERFYDHSFTCSEHGRSSRTEDGPEPHLSKSFRQTGADPATRAADECLANRHEFLQHNEDVEIHADREFHLDIVTAWKIVLIKVMESLREYSSTWVQTAI